jgi:hypothetical protein
VKESWDKMYSRSRKNDEPSKNRLNNKKLKVKKN